MYRSTRERRSGTASTGSKFKHSDFVDVTAAPPIISDLPVSTAHLYFVERVGSASAKTDEK
jgi:hypothetical protein